MSSRYAWDLDGDGQFDDATVAKPSWTYTTAGAITVRLQTSDGHGHTTTSSPVTVTVSNAAGSTRFVSDLPVVSQTNGWGPVELDRSNGEAGAGDGGPLTINGVGFCEGAWSACGCRCGLCHSGWVHVVCCSGRCRRRGGGQRVGCVRDLGRRHEAGQQPSSDGGRQRGCPHVPTLRARVSCALSSRTAATTIDYDHADWG